MKKISISKIAEMAGVSKTTVSVVLNNRCRQYGISVKTEEKIRELIHRHDYRPNSLARSLRLKKSMIIGLIVPELNNWFFSQLSNDLEIVLRRFGYRLYVTSSHYDEKTEHKTIRDLFSWNIRGVIVASVMQREYPPDDIAEYDRPLIYIDRRVEGKNAACVETNNFQGAYDLVSHLCSWKSEKICYVGGVRNVSTFSDRYTGYRKALEDNRVPLVSDMVFEQGATPEDAYNMFKEIYKRMSGLPEALFIASCDFLMGFLQFVRDEPKSNPADMLIGTFDDHQILDFMPFRISSVRQNTREMAMAAFRLLEKNWRGEGGNCRQVVSPELIKRIH